MRKYFLLPVVLSLAFLMATADFAHAQRRGGGGGGGRGGSWGGRGGGWGRGGNVGVYIAPGFGYGYRGYGGYGYRSYYGGPYYDDTYVTPSYSYYSDPAYVEPAPDYYSNPAPMDYANIRVIVPDPNAHVWFDGAATRQTGTDRLFSTPSMNAGASGTYRIRASWTQQGREINQERVVTVSPGQSIMVDFNQPSSEGIRAPK